MVQSSRPSAKRPRVQSLDDSFEDPPAGNAGGGGYESFDEDCCPTQPVAASQSYQQQHSQMFYAQSQYQSQLADVGQVIMLKKQKENAQNALMRLEKEKAAREYEFNKQKRELEERKNTEIKGLREELGSLKREYAMLSFRQPSNNLDISTDSSLNTTNSVLPTKKVDLNRPTTFQNRWTTMNSTKPVANHSIFKHPNCNPNESFTPLSTQTSTKTSVAQTYDSLPKIFNFPEKEMASKSCQVDKTERDYEIQLSKREAILEQIIETSLNLPSEKFNNDDFLDFCSKIRGEVAENFLEFLPHDESNNQGAKRF
ncbi:unnamed protein product [Auanema sp. JU1783]|nr:unnamed protein product [Auanema sp. JU1783]